MAISILIFIACVILSVVACLIIGDEIIRRGYAKDWSRIWRDAFLFLLVFVTGPSITYWSVKLVMFAMWGFMDILRLLGA
jgi:hypothetical protein